MTDIILYGSRYGSGRRYAKWLAQTTGIPAVDHRQAPTLDGYATIVYMGSLYAGGMTGLKKTFRHYALPPGQRLIIVSVGIADPTLPENQAHIRASLQKQLAPALYAAAEFYHLRGAIDYSTLSFVHRAMMAKLCHDLKKRPASALSDEDRAVLATYGGQIDFADAATLSPLIDTLQNNQGGTHHV